MVSVRGKVRMVLGDVGSPRSRIRTALATMLASLGTALAADAEVQGRINTLIEGAANQIIARRSAIGGFIADVIKQWDAPHPFRSLQLVIGSDLAIHPDERDHRRRGGRRGDLPDRFG